MKFLPGLPALIVFGQLSLVDSLWSAESPDWWQAAQDLQRELKKPETELFPLVQQAAARRPQTAQEAMLNLCLLMRAGMTAEAASGLEELKRLAPDLHHAQISHIYDETCDRLANWELAQKLLETFAENVSDVTLDNRLFSAQLSSGWTVDQIDRWLTARPPGLDGFWIKERLRFGVAHGRGQPLIQEMTEQLKRDPSNIKAALVFLDAQLQAQLPEQEMPKLKWMAAAYRPRLLTEAADLASRLRRLKQWDAAIVFFQESLPTGTKQLTEQELERLGRSSQLAVGPEALRVRFEVQQREEMARCLLDLGRPEEAQAVMVEAADLRQEFGLGPNPLLAGRVGGEDRSARLHEGEPGSMEDPRYWLERADYSHGRELAAEEETALQRGLELAIPKPESTRPAKRAEDLRSQLVSRYARFLATQRREDEAVALLHRELAEGGSASAARAAHLLAFDFADCLRPDDEVIWTWLDRRSVWEHSEQRLLWRMLQKATEVALLFSRAEELAAGQHPSRAYVLGWIMNRMGFPKRSLPLLRSAEQRATEPQEKGRAAYALFESYRDTGDWREAERSFVRADQGEWGECFSDLALRAAQAGAKADAMRLWRAVVKVNPSALGLLRPLAQAGLANELNAFYDEFERALPSSDIPRRARRFIAEQ